MALQPPSFETCSDNLQFRITHYLVTLLQAARISSHRCGGSNRRAAAAERGTILFQLDKICKNLDYVFPDDGSHEIDVIHSIKETVVNVQQLYPQIQADLFPVILRRIPLTATQEEIFNSLNRSISEVMYLRKKYIVTSNQFSTRPICN